MLGPKQGSSQKPRLSGEGPTSAACVARGGGRAPGTDPLAPAQPLGSAFKAASVPSRWWTQLVDLCFLFQWSKLICAGLVHITGRPHVPAFQSKTTGVSHGVWPVGPAAFRRWGWTRRLCWVHPTSHLESKFTTCYFYWLTRFLDRKTTRGTNNGLGTANISSKSYCHLG